MHSLILDRSPYAIVQAITRTPTSRNTAAQAETIHLNIPDVCFRQDKISNLHKNNNNYYYLTVRMRASAGRGRGRRVALVTAMEQYHILGRVGEGAHGIVLKAKHIKVLLIINLQPSF